jgi:23S rRNA (adenine1618-N6)-methyltransferase
MNRKKRKSNSTNAPASFQGCSRVQCNLEAIFLELSNAYKDFDSAWKELKENRRENAGKCFSSHVNYNFNVSLTRAILDKEFGLKLPSMPEENLVPPVPNRLNYVLWIKTLIHESSSKEYFRLDDNATLVRRGLDLGTGCSAIYPLLLSTKRFSDDYLSWNFLGTDIDPKSLKSADENIAANNLQSVIKTVQVCKRKDDEFVVDADTCSLDDFQQKVHSINLDERSTPLYTAMNASKHFYKYQNEIMFDFVLTNPPFYTTLHEASQPRDDGRERTDMTYSESVYPSGEIGFARDIVTDSLIFRKSVTWYTIMLSKKTSLLVIERDLLKIGFPRASIRTAEFVQGKMTRWAIGWTFLDSNLRSPYNLLSGGLQSFDVKLEQNLSVGEVYEEIKERTRVFCSQFHEAQLRCVFASEQDVLSIEDDSPSPSFAIDFKIDCENFVFGHTSTLILQNYALSSDDLQKVRRIQVLIEGEICRTSRKYRRLQKRTTPVPTSTA